MKRPGAVVKAQLAAGLFLLLALTAADAGAAQGIFSSTGSMTTPRRLHAVTLLPDGKVLLTGGDNGSGLVASAELYNPATRTFTPTGNMTEPRELHTATLLADGSVLIAGGDTNFQVAAELYNPAVGIFVLTGNTVNQHAGATATLLADGRVLLVSGFGPFTSPVGTELYNPSTGIFALTGDLSTPRNSHTATLLPDGTVLIAGGIIPSSSPPSSSSILQSAELYGPVAGNFTQISTMTQPRSLHTATLLADGRVLIAGGVFLSGGTFFFAGAELYDPATGAFIPTGNLSTPRYLHTATLLPNGKVLIAGGNDFFGALATAELYDPVTGTFSPTQRMGASRYSHAATLLSDGTVLISGGFGGAGTLANAELFLPDVQAQTVAIDIKPGSFPNSINLGSGGTVPVAIFGTPTFDARTIDPLTVTLASASVQLKGRGTPMASFEDVNRDGFLDLVIHVRTEALQLTERDTVAVLQGNTFTGTFIIGTDSVRVVP